MFFPAYIIRFHDEHVNVISCTFVGNVGLPFCNCNNYTNAQQYYAQIHENSLTGGNKGGKYVPNFVHASKQSMTFTAPVCTKIRNYPVNLSELLYRILSELS